MIGFQAQTSLADGLAQTMQWMQTKSPDAGY
jgi:hypothetical protein